MMSWRTEQMSLMETLEAQKGVIDGFIKMQAKSGNACSARLLEAKQTLDALWAEVKDLTIQVKSHDKVLEAETKVLETTLTMQDHVEDKYHDDIMECVELMI